MRADAWLLAFILGVIVIQAVLLWRLHAK